MEVTRFIFNGFGENTYILTDKSTGKCLIVDPGMMDDEERSALDSFISRNNLIPVGIVDTHMHIDHVLGNTHVAEKYNAPLYAHQADAFLGERVSEQAAMFGMGREGFSTRKIDIDLSKVESLKVGDSELKILHVPGHSPGSVALYDAEGKFVITGDALFAGSIGRTDLPGGDYATLIGAIQKQLLTLPDDTVVYPGHGSPTTIASEKKYNPFL